MSQFSIKLYHTEHKALWDNFVKASDIDSFLFYRDFMEYHKNRFEDFSLMIFEDEELVAILPANKVESSLYSHQGLTYGGLITKINTKNKIQELFRVLKAFLKTEGLEVIIIKEVPSIYCRSYNSTLSDFINIHFKTYHQNEVLAVNYSKPLQIHKTKLKHYRKSDQFDFEIREETNFEPFWKQILEPLLLEKFNSKPVHTLDEITLLNKLFPKNIKQFSVYGNDKILAGITIFETDTVVKSQYGAINEEGKKIRALDFLFLQLIEKFKLEGKQFFSMGTVTNLDLPDGYNKGLMKQKLELGCDIFKQNYFKLEL